MAAVGIYDRVKEASTTTGTGSFTTSGAEAGGFVTINSVVGTGNTFYYCIQNSSVNEWEVGIGTSTGALTFSRDTVLASSNAGSLVNFSAGTKDCFITAAAAMLAPMTTTGDTIYLAANGRPTRLAVGTSGQAHMVTGAGIPSWGTIVGITSGAVGSGSVASGAVQGYFGPTPNVASGTMGVFDFGSGAVSTGTIGSGAVVSGNVASGQLGRFHIASGQLAGFELGSGAIVSGRIASGQIGSFHIGSGQLTGFELGSGSIVSGRIASGQIGSFHIGSGQLTGFELGSGAIVSGRIASGQIGNFAVSSGAVTSGRLGVTGTPNGAQFLRDDFTWQVGTGSSTLAYFTPLDNQPPASVYAVLGSRNNHTTLEFDNSTNWSAIFEGVLARTYAGGNITVSIAWAALSGTSGNVAWLGSWERLNANNTNLDTDNFSATQISSADACNVTNGKLTVSTITFTSAQISSLAAGDAFRFKLTRDTTAASNLAARAQVVAVEIRG